MEMDPRTQAESEAIKQRYARRSALPPGRYDIFAPDVVLRAQSAERALVKLLKSKCADAVPRMSILEIGCGEGINLLQMIRLGFNPALMVGNDLRDDAVTVARRILPGSVRFIAGEASSADFGPETFDLVIQSTVFSSILDHEVRAAVARRAWQLTKPCGAILWYDLAHDNPWNRDVRGVPLAEVRALFPGAEIAARRVTLAPPIARAVTAVHASLYSLFDAIPFLRSHLLCWIAKPGAVLAT